MPTPEGAKLVVSGSIRLRAVGIGVGAVSTAKLNIKNGGTGGNLLGSVVLNQTRTAIRISSPGAFSIAPDNKKSSGLLARPMH
jgi:hypothetical protein